MATIIIISEARQTEESVTLVLVSSCVFYSVYASIRWAIERASGNKVQRQPQPTRSQLTAPRGYPTRALPRHTEQPVQAPRRASNAQTPIQHVKNPNTQFAKLVTRAWVSIFGELYPDSRAECIGVNGTSVGITVKIEIETDAETFKPKDMERLRNRITSGLRKYKIKHSNVVVFRDGIDVTVIMNTGKIEAPSIDTILENSKGVEKFCLGVNELGEPIIESLVSSIGMLFVAPSGGGKTVHATAVMAGILQNYSPDKVQVSLMYTKPENWTKEAGGESAEFGIWTSSVPHVTEYAHDPREKAEMIISAWDKRNDRTAKHHILFIDDLQDIISEFREMGAKGKKAISRLGTLCNSGRTSGIRIFATTQNIENSSSLGGTALIDNIGKRIVGRTNSCAKFLACSGQTGQDVKAMYAALSGKHGDNAYFSSGEVSRCLSPYCPIEVIEELLIKPHINNTPITPNPEEGLGIWDDMDGTGDMDEMGDEMAPYPTPPHPPAPTLSPSPLPTLLPSHPHPPTLSPSHSLTLSPSDPLTLSPPSAKGIKGPKEANIGGEGGCVTSETCDVMLDVTSFAGDVTPQITHVTPQITHDESSLLGVIEGKGEDIGDEIEDAIYTLSEVHDLSTNRIVLALWGKRSPKRTTIVNEILSKKEDEKDLS